jgi:hypothetical protein
MNGHAKIGNLTLKSSQGAKNYSPTRMRQSDWMLLSSIKPEYDNPSEKIDGITLPGRLTKWFLDAGFSTAIDNTNLVGNKGKALSSLLNAQSDYSNGFSIIMLVDHNILYSSKQKSCVSMFPSHWITLTSDIKVSMYNEKTKKLSHPTIINKKAVNDIKQGFQVEFPEDGFPTIKPSTKVKNSKAMLGVFTWGTANKPLNSNIPCIMERYYGYIKVKM